MEPLIQIDDIQGHVVPGFGTAHTAVIGLRIVNYPVGRELLLSLLPFVTSSRKALGEKDNRRQAFASGLTFPPSSMAMLSVSLASTALRAFDVNVDAFDPSFISGMRADAHTLNDPVDTNNVPTDWKFSRDSATRLDVLLVGGHNDKLKLEIAVNDWVARLAPALEVIVLHYGRRRSGEKEFFGFLDGASQPAIRGVDDHGEPISRREIEPQDPRSQLFAKPGQRLVWPGAFLFGYPRETTVPANPGPIRVTPTNFMSNGSYLVFRALRQDIGAFKQGVSDLEDFIRERGEVIPDGWVAAGLVGRWPDGTPLVASPNAPDSEVSGDPDRINNFAFASITPETPLVGLARPVPAVPADPLGHLCPRYAHIRKVNPRDGSSEIGHENHTKKLILRRGTAFGPEPWEASDESRGLLFLSYQTSIVDQFLFLQENWANATTRPTGGGIDPIIGQDGTADTKRELLFMAPSGKQITCPFNGRWVIPEGGEYFVTPGLSGLKALLSGSPG